MDAIPIRSTDPGQTSEEIQSLARRVSDFLTTGEEILYIALQSRLHGGFQRDALVATTRRLIFFRPSHLGTLDFKDYQWQDIKDATLKQNMTASELAVETTQGAVDVMTGLIKDQARRLYSVCQQQEEEWRERRRVRGMEEQRARSGGIVVGATPPAGPVDDPVIKLAQAKSMWDQGLISEAEYQAIKAKILAAM